LKKSIPDHGLGWRNVSPAPLRAGIPGVVAGMEH